jgi:Domain of unknown function (DUF4136)
MRVATLISTAALLWTTTAWAQDVSYDYDKSVNFGALKTYAWAPDGNIQDELTHKRIVAAVDAQLATKGLRKVEAGATPDVVVVYKAGVRQELQVNGYGAYRLNRWNSARVEQVPVGALMVELLNAKTKDVLWRGIATKDLDVDASPEKREKNINKAAEKLFKNYPPTK